MAARGRRTALWTLGIGALAVLLAVAWTGRGRVLEEWRLRRLRSRLESAPDPQVEGAPPIAAVVQAVGKDENRRLVVLSVGKDQKVEEGCIFVVHRNGRFVAKLKAIKVYEDLCGAELVEVQDGESVQVGDKAETRP